MAQQKLFFFCKTFNYAIQTYLGIQFDFTLYQNLLLYNKHYGMEWKEMPDFAICFYRHTLHEFNGMNNGMNGKFVQ